jgi:hypothetical protein
VCVGTADDEALLYGDERASCSSEVFRIGGDYWRTLTLKGPSRSACVM